MKKPAGKTKTRAAAPRRATVAERAPKSSAPKSSAGTAAKAAARSATTAAGTLDPAFVEALAAIVARHDLTEVSVEHAGLHIRVARQLQAASAPAQNYYSAPAPAVMAPPPVAATPSPLAAAPAPADHPGTVKSPMVGTVYRRPSPEAKAFVDVGSQVKAGEKILLVEAMKTFNEIVAPRAGTVTAIMVEDGQPIEYGQPLLVIE